MTLILIILLSVLFTMSICALIRHLQSVYPFPQWKTINHVLEPQCK